MKTLKELKAKIPGYAKDVKANLENLLSKKNKAMPQKNIFGAALASAYATREKALIRIMENEAKKHLSAKEISVAKTAAVMMAMNNNYFCFTHLSVDKEYLEMPASLVMGSVKNHKINKIDFEVFVLAASIVNSCSMCIDSHEELLFRSGFLRDKIQMVAQIAAVVTSVAQIFAIQN